MATESFKDQDKTLVEKLSSIPGISRILLGFVQN